MQRYWYSSIIFIYAAFLLISCQRLPNVQGRGSDALQGVWIQDSVKNSGNMISYTTHKFRISCDSFYVDLTTYSKVNYYADSCFKNGVWNEYAKGVYVQRGDSIFLEGTYTKENYKQKLGGCYQVGRYIKSFRIKEASAGKLLLESTDNQRELSLSLTDKITCVPKEL